MSPSGPYRLASSELSFLHPQSLGLSRGHFYFAQRGHYHFAASAGPPVNTRLSMPIARLGSHAKRRGLALLVWPPTRMRRGLSRQLAEGHEAALSLENRIDGPGCVARLRLPV